MLNQVNNKTQTVGIADDNVVWLPYLNSRISKHFVTHNREIKMHNIFQVHQ